MPAQMDPHRDRQYLSRQYTDAVADNGGIPLILPLLPEPDTMRSLAETLGGILLTGSNSDVDPAHYRSPRLEECGPTQPLRDRTDFFLLKIGIERRIPILAICFGVQSLNVFMGGTLIQDIPSYVKGCIRHENYTAGKCPRHEIKISSGSILEEILETSEASVNSTHHQAVDRLGHGLQVDARAPDGVIEAISSTTREHWILGVQWHPEKDFADDGLSQRVFGHFLARCRAIRISNEGIHT